MKRLSIVVFVVIARLILQPVGALAIEGDEFEPEEMAPEKDLCVLYASQCGTTVQSLQDKIYRLQEEIEKGTKVYTPEELWLLRQHLEDANRRLGLFFNE
jgi:hypothetical protein